MKAIIIALFIVASLQTIPWPFQSCSATGASLISITKVEMDSQPVKGQKDQIHLYGTAQQHIDVDHVNIQVLLNGAPLHSEVSAFKNSYDQGDSVEFDFTALVVSFAPAGNYKMTFNFQDGSSKSVDCTYIEFKF